MLASLALAGSTAFATWWTTTLSGLPDVGDPFDVAAFCRPIPDEANAYSFYRRAVAALPPGDPVTLGGWSAASPAERGLLGRSRAALALWREGTERPDALDLDPAKVTLDRYEPLMQVRNLGRLALLEGGRLEEAGDLTGAFGWYRALLRSSRHCGRRGGYVERLIGVAMHRWAVYRLAKWADDPRVDTPTLRLALLAAREAEAATPSLSDGLKTEYLALMHSFGDPDAMARLLDHQVVTTPGGSTTVYGKGGWKPGWIGARRRLMNEPERGRRVLRLILANRLAGCDQPAASRPFKALVRPKLAPPDPTLDLLATLYRLPPDPSRPLSPEQIAHWFATAPDLEPFLTNPENLGLVIAQEKAVRTALLVALANELHRRDHGRYPGRAEELVGPYLKALPEDLPPSAPIP